MSAHPKAMRDLINDLALLRVAFVGARKNKESWKGFEAIAIRKQIESCYIQAIAIGDACGALDAQHEYPESKS